jgi:replication factor C subunit 1
MEKYINKNSFDINEDKKEKKEVYLWSDKYKPKCIDEMIGNKKNIETIKKWLSDFKNNKKDVERSLFISGPPGIGKTTIAHLILKHYNYDIIEFNASDVRSQKSVKDNLLKILNNTNVSLMQDNNIRNIGIIMDEVDGMSSGDRGGVSELVSIITPPKKDKRSKKDNKKCYINPIICICNNNTEKKLSDLKKICLEINFTKPSNNDLKMIADKIILNEKIKIDDDAVQLIINYSQNDVRRLTFLLKDIAKTFENKQITSENIETLYKSFSKKNLDIGLFEATNKLLNNYNNLDDTMILYESDKSLMAMMMHENFINIIQKNRKDNNSVKLEKIYEIIHNLCIGDIIDKYIYNNQYWGLQGYNGIIKCSLPSKIINNMDKSLCYNSDINFTSLLSKSALQYGNQKNFILIKDKLQISKKYVMYANEIILNELMGTNDNDNIKKSLQRIINYNMDINDLEKIIKLNKIDKQNEFRKNYTTKNKNKYKKIFKSIIEDYENNSISDNTETNSSTDD